MASSVTAMQVAQHFLALQDEDAGDLISNLKLQKLLYYAQGIHLALSGQPLYPERIEAWQHGPVVPEIYHAFKEYRARPIPVEKGKRPAIRDEAVIDFLNEVYDVFGQYSAWKLRNMTYEEPPYKEAEDSQGEISQAAMRHYFQRCLNNETS